MTAALLGPLAATDMSVLIGFAWLCLVIELTPGPNMTYLAVLSLGSGRSAGLSAVAGVALGLLLVGLAAALGLAAVISGSPVLYDLVRWGGIGYLVWLAWETWRNAGDLDAAAEPVTEDLLRYVRQGFITNVLNPKAALFYIAVLPQFVATQQAVLPQHVVLTLVYVTIATLIHVGIVLLASSSRLVLEDRIGMRRVSQVLAVVLAMVAVWFAVTTRRV